MNTTTGVSPFFTNKGYHPEITSDPQAKTSSAKAQTFVADLECVQVELKENITQAQERYWKNADKHRVEVPELNILGPYDVIGKPGTHSVTLHLPHQFHSVHPVFHMSQLEPAQPNPFPL